MIDLETVFIIYASIVSTFSLLWKIRDERKNRSANFHIKFGFKIIKSEEKGVYYFDNIKIRVINSKNIERKVRINSIQYYNVGSN